MNTRKASLCILHAYSPSNIVRDESSCMMFTAGIEVSGVGEREVTALNSRTFPLVVFDMDLHHFYLKCEHISSLERLDERLSANSLNCEY